MGHSDSENTHGSTLALAHFTCQVPGWDLQLQKSMNRLFTHLTPDT